MPATPLQTAQGGAAGLRCAETPSRAPLGPPRATGEPRAFAADWATEIPTENGLSSDLEIGDVCPCLAALTCSKLHVVCNKTGFGTMLPVYAYVAKPGGGREAGFYAAKLDREALSNIQGFLPPWRYGPSTKQLSVTQPLRIRKVWLDANTPPGRRTSIGHVHVQWSLKGAFDATQVPLWAVRLARNHHAWLQHCRHEANMQAPIPVAMPHAAPRGAEAVQLDCSRSFTSSMPEWCQLSSCSSGPSHFSETPSPPVEHSARAHCGALPPVAASAATPAVTTAAAPTSVTAPQHLPVNMAALSQFEVLDSQSDVGSVSAAETPTRSALHGLRTIWFCEATGTLTMTFRMKLEMLPEHDSSTPSSVSSGMSIDGVPEVRLDEMAQPHLAREMIALWDWLQLCVSHPQQARGNWTGVFPSITLQCPDLRFTWQAGCVVMMHLRQGKLLGSCSFAALSRGSSPPLDHDQQADWMCLLRDWIYCHVAAHAATAGADTAPWFDNLITGEDEELARCLYLSHHPDVHLSASTKLTHSRQAARILHIQAVAYALTSDGVPTAKRRLAARKFASTATHPGQYVQLSSDITNLHAAAAPTGGASA